jgi:hypothetical protein
MDMPKDDGLRAYTKPVNHPREGREAGMSHLKRQHRPG